MARRTSSAPPGAIAPATAAQIRRLLKLSDEAGDDEIRRKVATQADAVKAALDLGFSTTFQLATLTGQVDPAERDFWREQFHDNPDPSARVPRADLEASLMTTMNPQKHGSEEGLKSIAEFAQLMTSIKENPLAPRQEPAPKGPTVPAPETPAALDKEGRALYERVEKRAQDEKVDWFTAFAKVTGNTEFKPPRVVPGPSHGSEPISLEDEDQLGQVLMRSHAIGYLDAVQLVRHTKELAETRKGPETDVPWLDTRPLSAPPRPWSAEDWERDRRRAAAGNVSLERVEWEVAAEKGEDLVSERAEKARADHLAGLEARSEHHVRTAQAAEAKMREAAIEAELDRRAESRIEDLKSRRGRF